MAYTKFKKVRHVSYAGMVALHYYVPRSKKAIKAIEDFDPFLGLFSGPRINWKACNTKWKMSRDKKEIYAICAHGIKFVLDERD